ncbi:hypothetical protein [Kitasatospora sp. McL0602]|uniref:hypothetical protein n=1 Tax=Kitasatospora sp. McL0602 TaxID=3439530 RepID=UPI003F89CFE6
MTAAIASSAAGLRVVHLPARTPYARKLHGPGIHTLNTTTEPTEIRPGHAVPADVTASWILDHTPLDWLDVLHLHHIDLEPPAILERLLDACARARVRVVFTAHDTRPMLGGDSNGADAFTTRLRLLLAADVPWICLTEGSRADLAALLGTEPPTTVIPHGYVVPPDTLRHRERLPGTGVRTLLYGATRTNRDQISPVVNWSLATSNPTHTLHLLLRAASPADFTRTTPSPLPVILDIARHDPRIRITMRPYPTDTAVLDAALASDLLLLPYLWGTHSGQLELAFDLGLIPVCARVGHLPEQHRLHQRHDQAVPEPEWFDWTTGHPNLFGERFLTALESATARTAAAPRRLDHDFLDYRTQEHKDVLAAHLALYEGGHR